MKTKKELDAKVDRVIDGCQKLSKDVVELGQRVASTSSILQDFLGVMELLKQKGIISDEELTEAVTNARKKYLEQKRIQSEIARAVEAGRGYVGQQLLRTASTNFDRRSQGDKIK